MNNEVPPLPQPVLVTGGAGFIGRHLVAELVALGNETIVFDLPSAAQPAEWAGRVSFIPGDIANREDVREAMKGIGTVFHTAAVVSDWAPRDTYERVTLEGSRYLFEEAVGDGTRVLLLSSFAVYGDRIGRGIIREEEAFGRPFGLYGEYKQRQEKLAWSFHREKHLQLSVVRPSKVYGPGSGPWLFEVAKVLSQGKPGLVAGGDHNPGLVYVENLVDILILAAALPQAAGRAYHGYDGTRATMRQYFADIAGIIGAPPPRSMPRWVAKLLAAVSEPAWKLLGKKTRPLLTKDSLGSISREFEICTARVEKEMGYTPKISYEEGIRRVADYWQKITSKERSDG